MRALRRGHGLSLAALMGRTDWFVGNPYDGRDRRTEDAEHRCRLHSAGALDGRNLALIAEPLYLCREETGISLEIAMVAHRELRRLAHSNGPGGLSAVETQRELLRSDLRCGVLPGSEGTGLLPWTARFVRNSREIDPEMARNVEGMPSRVLAPRVAGLEG